MLAGAKLSNKFKIQNSKFKFLPNDLLFGRFYRFVLFWLGHRFVGVELKENLADKRGLLHIENYEIFGTREGRSHLGSGKDVRHALYALNKDRVVAHEYKRLFGGIDAVLAKHRAIPKVEPCAGGLHLLHYKLYVVGRCSHYDNLLSVLLGQCAAKQQSTNKRRDDGATKDAEFCHIEHLTAVGAKW